MPTGSRALQSVNSSSENQPRASSGTPRTTLPSAAPRKTARSALAAQKTVSQAWRQSGEATWLRNSMATPRRMRDQRTSMMAK